MRPALWTLLYIFVLAFSPWFFSHQSCGPDTEGLNLLLNAVNCKMHFPGPERTLEAYGTWFAAVFASAALFWAWKGFSVQSRTLEAQVGALRVQGETLRLQAETLQEQQRGMFLNSLSAEYERSLEDAAFWAMQDVYQSSLCFEDQAKDKNDTNNQVKMIYHMAMMQARKDIKEISDLMQNSDNIKGYIRIAREYNVLIERYNLGILRIGSGANRAWVNILGNFEGLEALHRKLTPTT